MADQTTPDPLTAHYGGVDLMERVRAALHAAGKDVAPTLDDLAPLDQFHIGGREATRQLAELAGLRAGLLVLDVGGGIGGPARGLACGYGCNVTVLDVTEDYCRIGEMLTSLTGLTECVGFRHGNALDMPFGDGQFDVVWTQHSSMNVDDKERLYAEIRRVLRPGGRLALHEVMSGPVQPVHFPVPWARDPAISYLRPAAEIRALLAASGFAEVAWNDVSAAALATFRARPIAVPGASPPPLGLHMLLGPEIGDMSRTMRRNLEEERVVVIQAVFDRA
jgi:ubiquinone/menaquinone biosynthesis C-methylase UbiE